MGLGEKSPSLMLMKNFFKPPFPRRNAFSTRRCRCCCCGRGGCVAPTLIRFLEKFPISPSQHSTAHGEYAQKDAKKQPRALAPTNLAFFHCSPESGEPATLLPSRDYRGLWLCYVRAPPRPRPQWRPDVLDCFFATATATTWTFFTLGTRWARLNWALSSF